MLAKWDQVYLDKLHVARRSRASAARATEIDKTGERSTRFMCSKSTGAAASGTACTKAHVPGYDERAFKERSGCSIRIVGL